VSALGASLAQSLLGSADLIGQIIYEGRSLSQALDTLEPKSRPAIQSLTFAALRTWASAQQLINQLIPKKPSKEVDLLLSVAITLIINQSRGENQNRYPIHTIVNEAVKAATMTAKTKHASGLINAVLRKVSGLQDNELDDQTIGIAYPKWWIKQLQGAYPNELQIICANQQQRPPLVLRINVKKITPSSYRALLDSKKIAYRVIEQIGNMPVNTAIAIVDPIPVSQIPGFEDGLVSVQDAGAQLAAILLNPQRGERILDACAAPGGKTAHIAEYIQANEYHLTALEIDGERLKKVSSNIERLELPRANIKVMQGSAEKRDWWDGLLFDKILLDVPCSASGIVRRHPDIVFLRRQDDIPNLVKTQRTLLKRAWQKLKPGGLLLYATCSIFPQEGEEQMAWFVSQHPNALRLDAPGQLLPDENHDGFFYGLLMKSKE
jgi:16S rRNA (cytosine967-C5)-methyltransferase